MFGAFPSNVVKEMLGGASGLMKTVFNCFFGCGGVADFRRGVALPCDGSSRQKKLFRASIKCLLADEAALKSVVQFKGAGGSLCCALCTNIANCDRCQLEGQDKVHHYADARPAQFELRSDERTWRTFDDLLAQKTTMLPTAFQKLTRNLGFRDTPCLSIPLVCSVGPKEGVGNASSAAQTHAYLLFASPPWLHAASPGK